MPLPLLALKTCAVGAPFPQTTVTFVIEFNPRKRRYLGTGTLAFDDSLEEGGLGFDFDLGMIVCYLFTVRDTHCCGRLALFGKHSSPKCTYDTITAAAEERVQLSSIT